MPSPSLVHASTLNPPQFFLKALYPHARVFRFLLVAVDPRYFEADHDLVASLTTVKNQRELSIELTRFRYHPLNNGWLRRKLRLRISTHRCRELVGPSLSSRTGEQTAARF